MSPASRKRPGRKLYRGKRALHLEDLLNRGPDKHIVEQQGPLRVDHLSVHLPLTLHIGGGEILERLPTTLAPGKLGIQAFSGADLSRRATPVVGSVSTYQRTVFQVMTLCQPATLSSDRLSNIHHYDYLFPEDYSRISLKPHDNSKPYKRTIFYS